MKPFIILTLLVLGLVAVVSVVGQKTQTQQEASAPINLNTASEIDPTSIPNSDGTMGPKTSSDNFSPNLPSAYLGNLALNIIYSNPAQKISSLKLNLSKVEAHLIYLFLPGTDSSNISEIEKKNLDGRKTNQNVNNWETLKLNENAHQPANTQLAGGKYSEIRLYVSKVTALLINGKEAELNIPGRANIIRVVKTFNIFSNKTTNLTLNLDVEKSVLQSGDTYFFEPFVSQITVGN